MAALNGLGIDNLTIEIDGEELPGMDGSSLEFLKALQEAGIVEQQADKNIFVIQEPIVVANKTSTIVIVPHDQLNISYTLDYDHPLLRSQFFSLRPLIQLLLPMTWPQRAPFALNPKCNEIQPAWFGPRVRIIKPPW